MRGRHIGALNITLKAEHSERRVWYQGRNDHGDRWIFAQTTIQNEKPYKASIDAESICADRFLTKGMVKSYEPSGPILPELILVPVA